ARQIALQEAPHQHLHQRPVDELRRPRPGGADDVPVAQDHAPYPPGGGGERRLLSKPRGVPLGPHYRPCSWSAGFRRAMASNTSSRLVRRKRWISSGGVSSAITRPRSNMMTRSASRSTSAILWEASTTVARRSAQ